LKERGIIMKRILIVDDAEFIRLTLKKMLEANGFEVVGQAADGVDAVAKYKLFKPDLVTMDITMPKMDGLEALAEIMSYDSNAKVVMLSALGQENIVKRTIVFGAKTFIVKPFKEEHVVKTLNTVLNI
jgi:two-component system chemotaxis response regulator CheY